MTVVIEGEDEDVMKSGACCLECELGRVVGEDEATSRGVFIQNPGCVCPSRGEKIGQTCRRFCMTTLPGRADGQRAPSYRAHGPMWQ